MPRRRLFRWETACSPFGIGNTFFSPQAIFLSLEAFLFLNRLSRPARLRGPSLWALRCFFSLRIQSRIPGLSSSFPPQRGSSSPAVSHAAFFPLSVPKEGQTFSPLPSPFASWVPSLSHVLPPTTTTYSLPIPFKGKPKLQPRMDCFFPPFCPLSSPFPDWRGTPFVPETPIFLSG